MFEKRLNRYLNSVGKECFTNYFHLFNDEKLSNAEIIEVIHNERGYTEKACASKTGHARMIIRENGAIDAMEIIAGSGRLDTDVI